MSWTELEKGRWVREVGADGVRVELLLAAGEAFAFVFAGGELVELDLDASDTGRITVDEQGVLVGQGQAATPSAARVAATSARAVAARAPSRAPT